MITNSEDIAISGTGVGNAGFLLEADIEERNAQGEISASVVNTDHMDNLSDSVSQKVLYGDMGISVPYGLKSFSESTIYGQNIGFKSEAGVAKSTFSHENSPLNGTFNFAQGEAKINYEDYTFSAGAGVSAQK
jgi:toxin YxiD